MRRNYRDELFVEKVKKRHTFSLVLLCFMLVLLTVISVYNMIISSHVGIRKYSVTVNALPSRLEGTRILVMSDLHGASFGVNQAELVNLINSQTFDVLCIVGDVTDRAGSPRALIRVLDQLDGGKPVLFIPGDEDPLPLDTDALSDGEAKASYIRLIEQTGAIYLDTPYRYENGSSVIWFSPESVFALDLDTAESAAVSRKNELLAEDGSAQRDAYLLAADYQLDRISRIRDAQRTMLPTDIHVALTHVPLSDQALRDLHDMFYGGKSLYIQGVSLVLAGHFNAGQWRLPWGSAFYIPQSFPVSDTGFFVNDAYLTGVKSVVGVNQVITAGLSVSNAYPGVMRSFRLFNQPMLSMVTLTRKITD